MGGKKEEGIITFKNNLDSDKTNGKHICDLFQDEIKTIPHITQHVEDIALNVSKLVRHDLEQDKVITAIKVNLGILTKIQYILVGSILAGVIKLLFFA